MLSRVADALYWMARYSERTENNAHILQIQLLNMLEQSGKENEYIDHWESVLDICASKEEYAFYNGPIRVNALIDYLLFSETNSNALLTTLYRIRENARISRDSIPIELWELQNTFHLYVQQEIVEREKPFPLISLHYFLQNVRKTSMTVTGLIEGSMDRDLPFYLIQIGKWLERAEKTIRMALITLEHQQQLKVALQDADGAFLLSLTRATESYLRKHRQTKLISVIQYLLHDEHFPRSVAFCLKKIEEALMNIEKDHLSIRFLELTSPLKTLLFDIIKIDLLTITIEEAILSMEERLSQCIDFSHAFATIYHLYEPIEQP